MDQSYITIHDATHPLFKFLHLSSGFAEFLGYEMDALKNRPIYEVMKDGEGQAFYHLSNYCRKSQKVCIMCLIELKKADGSFINCELISIFCNLILICTISEHQKDSATSAKTRSVEEAFYIENNTFKPLKGFTNFIFKRDHIRLLSQSAHEFYNDKEPRVAFILERFHRTPVINFASESSYFLLHMKEDRLRGTNFLDYVAPTNLNEVNTCLLTSKSKGIITRVDFDFKRPTPLEPRRVKCAFIPSAEGIISVLRANCDIPMDLTIPGARTVADIISSDDSESEDD